MYNYAQWGPPKNKPNFKNPLMDMKGSSVLDSQGVMLSKNSLGTSLSPPILKFVKKNY